jgi:hypothetical protein
MYLMYSMYTFNTLMSSKSTGLNQNFEVIDMPKENVLTVRLTQQELEKLDIHTRGQITRSQIVRTLIQDFIKKSEDDQRKFLIHKLLWPKN